METILWIFWCVLFLVMVVGFLSLIKPISRLGIRSRMSAARVFIVGLFGFLGVSIALGSTLPDQKTQTARQAKPAPAPLRATAQRSPSLAVARAMATPAPNQKRYAPSPMPPVQTATFSTTVNPQKCKDADKFIVRQPTTTKKEAAVREMGWLILVNTCLCRNGDNVCDSDFSAGLDKCGWLKTACVANFVLKAQARERAERAADERAHPGSDLCPPPLHMTAHDGCQAKGWEQTYWHPNPATATVTNPDKKTIPTVEQPTMLHGLVPIPAFDIDATCAESARENGGGYFEEKGCRDLEEQSKTALEGPNVPQDILAYCVSSSSGEHSYFLLKGCVDLEEESKRALGR
jgi:hypothetical protein